MIRINANNGNKHEICLTHGKKIYGFYGFKLAVIKFEKRLNFISYQIEIAKNKRVYRVVIITKGIKFILLAS